MADCPIHDFGELTQLDAIGEGDAADLAELGITNVRQLRQALEQNVPLPGFVENERLTWMRELRESDLRAVENDTVRHTQPNAGDVPPTDPPRGGGPPDDEGPIRPAPQVAPGVRRILNLLGRFGPNVELRALSSPSDLVRRLFAELVTTNLRLVDDGQPAAESVNAVIKGWHAHGNLAAERAHESYLRYLLDLPVGAELRDRTTILKAVVQEANATARRGDKVARHVYNELITIALERGGELAPGDARLVGLTGDLDPALRDAVLDGYRHKRQFYDAAFSRREQTGQAVLRRETYSPRFWDFDRVTGNEQALQDAIAENLTQKARAWVSEGRMTPEEFAEVEAYIRDQLPRYVDTVSTASFMRLPDEFAEFLTGSRSVRERTFGQIVLGEGETQRFLEPDFDVIAPYLHLDSMELLNRYLHSSIVDMELAARFDGDPTASARIQEIADDYRRQADALRERRAPARERAELAARAESDIKDMELLVAAMRNTDRIPSSPTSVRGLGERGLAALRNYTYLRIGGGMGIPSLGDVAAIATEHGVRRTMTQIVREMRDEFSNVARQASNRDLETLHLTFNDIGRQMGRNLFDISSYPAFGSTRFERLLTEGSNAMSTLNLLRPWTNIAKQAAARLITAHVDEVGERLARGLDVAHELELFRAAGLSEADVRRLHELRNLYGGKEGHYTWLGIDRWATGDRELANRFRNALIREVDRIVVTPGVYDVPFLMRQPVAATLLQFRKFGFSHTNRVLLPAMQAVAAGDLSVLHGMGLTFGVGAMVYMLKELTNKRELPTDIGLIIQESMARSDLWGIVGEMDGMSGALTGGVVTARGWLAPETFYGNRYMVSDLGSAVLGPGLRSAQELGRAFVAAASVTPFVTSTDRDVRAIRRVFPGQNFFYTDFLADVVEEGLSGAAAYFEGKPRDRQMEAVQ